jgi:phosphate/sulfate permease
MNLSIVPVALISAFVAYTNGANDVSKGIATLAGSGISGYRRLGSNPEIVVLEFE